MSGEKQPNWFEKLFFGKKPEAKPATDIKPNEQVKIQPSEAEIVKRLGELETHKSDLDERKAQKLKEIDVWVKELNQPDIKKTTVDKLDTRIGELMHKEITTIDQEIRQIDLEQEKLKTVMGKLVEKEKPDDATTGTQEKIADASDKKEQIPTVAMSEEGIPEFKTPAEAQIYADKISEEIKKMSEKPVDGKDKNVVKTKIEYLKNKLAEFIEKNPDVKTEIELPDLAVIKLVESIVKGEYFINKEAAKTKKESKKGKESLTRKDKVKEDLEKLLGSHNIEFDSNGNITKFAVEEKIKEFEESEKNEQTKRKTLGIVKGVLGTGLAAGGIAVAPVSLAVAPLLFGLGGVGIGRGVIDFVRGLRTNKKEVTRLDVERHDWEKYSKMLELAQKVESGEYKDSRAILELAVFIKDSEKKSLSTFSSWKKADKQWDMLKSVTGGALGAVTAVSGFFYAKHAIMEEIYKRGFDFDKDKLWHQVKKLKNGFAYLYNNANEPALMVQKQLEKRLGHPIGPGEEKYIAEWVSKMDKQAVGEYGGHLFKPGEQASVANYFQAIFNKEQAGNIWKLIAAGTTGAAINIWEAFSLKKKPEELDKELDKIDQLAVRYGTKVKSEDEAKTAKEKSEAEKAEEQKERAKEPFFQASKGEQYVFSYGGKDYRFEVLGFEDKDSDNPRIVLANIDKCPELKNSETGEIETEIRSVEGAFNLNAKKWEHPGYTPDEYNICETHKDVYNNVKQWFKLEFVGASNGEEAKSRLGLDPKIDTYAILSVDPIKNEVIIFDYNKPTDADNIHKKKLSDLITKINKPINKITPESSESKTDKPKKQRKKRKK